MTDDEIIAACKKYTSRRELRDSNRPLLSKVYKRKLINKALGHMPKERHYVAECNGVKSCSVCGIEKPVNKFYKASGGRVRGACKSCCDDQSAKWASENRERTREINRRSSKRYPEKVRDRALKKRQRNPALFACRDMLKRILRLTGERKSTKTESLLGYTVDEFRDHISSQFVEGMSWENHGEWHIDHIKPVNVMIAEGEARPEVINALSNLRPLWAKDNLARSRKARNDYSTD